MAQWGCRFCATCQAIIWGVHDQSQDSKSRGYEVRDHILFHPYRTSVNVGLSRIVRN